ncbi:hypothetical protein HHX47_DHR5001047 [Lentinula edodes]|nr:hypothetical protein HHX47_DHR5001047 [Lentinula edodes]
MDHNLRFSVSSFTEQGSYKLMELPPELCKVMEESLSEGGDSNSSSFYIKGQPGEDAVLCTQDKTYTIRSVSLSNSILVVTSPPDSDISFDGGDNGLPNIVIRDQLSQILELTQTVPKLHKLNTLLKGKEYGEDEEDNEDGMNVELAIDHSQNMEVWIFMETLRPISSIYLTKIIQYILNTLAALMLNHESVPVEKLCTTLADEHDVPRIVSVQVMGWFGDINEIDGKWKMDVNSVVKEAGLGILKDAKGNYLIAPAAPYSDHQVVKYFPISSLPIDPAQRFSDLFLTRSKWKNEDIVPFLSDIAVNSKERDKLLLKYARATTDAEGIWYTSRAQYNG